MGGLIRFLKFTGIASPPGRMDPKAYMLQQFSASERGQVNSSLQEGVEAVRILISEGFGENINRFNLKQNYNGDETTHQIQEAHSQMDRRGKAKKIWGRIVELVTRFTRDIVEMRLKTFTMAELANEISCTTSWVLMEILKLKDNQSAIAGFFNRSKKGKQKHQLHTQIRT
eukprot:Gb_31268 [translate_table: standard]